MKRIYNRLHLRFLYAKDFLIFGGVLSMISYMGWYYLGVKGLAALIWLKILGSLLGLYLHEKRRSKEIFFYLNNGLSKQPLLLFAGLLDIAVWIIGLVLLITLGL